MRLQPLTVEILTYAPTEFFHCTHCDVVFQPVGIGQKIHAEQREANLPDDLRREFVALSDWVRALTERYPGQIQFKIVDAASLEGVYKSLRYRARKLPVVIIDGKDIIAGSNYDRASQLVERCLADSADSSAAEGTAGGR